MKFRIYKDNKGRMPNGKIVADSSEGYSSKQACKAGLELVKGATNITVVEDD